MKYVPPRSSKKAKKYREAVYDFYGEMNDEEQKSANKILVYLQRPLRKVMLSEEEREVVFCVKSNIASGAYG